MKDLIAEAVCMSVSLVRKEVQELLGGIRV